MSISVTGEAKFAKQTGGRGQYGHVVLRLTLHEADTGVTVVNRLAGDPIPAQFIPAIEAGVQAFIGEGWLARRGYSGGVVELTDGSWHDTDSSDLAFHTAAVMAMDTALRQLPRRGEFADGDGSPGVREPRGPHRPRPDASMAVPELRDDA
jgi:translation elongation factor EF-G